MEVVKCQGRNDVSYSAEFTDCMGSRNAAHPGVRMQLRSATNKNLSGDDPHTEKNKVGTSADKMHMPSTAFALSDVSKKNSTAMKQALPTGAAYIGQGGGNAIGTSSSWLPSFHRSSSAK